MGPEAAGRDGTSTWERDARRLRLLAIILPLLFLVVLDLLRHTLLYATLHTVPGFLSTYALIGVAVVLFSYAIFRLVTRLQARINEQNYRLSVVNDIAATSARKLGLEELLDAGLSHVLRVMRADAGLMCLVDLQEEEHSAVCYRGFSRDLVQVIRRAKLRDDPIGQEVVRTGRPVVIERVLDDPRVREGARREGIRSSISVPLKSEGEVNGILVVCTRSERHFTAADEEFLTAIGGQLGMAIRNAALFEESERTNRDLAALVTVGKAASSSLDLDELLRRSLDTIIEVTAAEAAEIWLADAEGLAARCHRGADPEAFLARTRFLVGEGIPGLVAERRVPLLVHDLPNDPRFLREGVVRAGYDSFCAVPLEYRERLVGVLAVAARSPGALRRADEVSLLDAFGERLAAAIVNAELHRQVRLLAVAQEREWIAREMHDGMAQVLGYINTQTLAVKKLFSDGRTNEGNAELARMQKTVRDLYADVREGIMGLRAASPNGRGLQAALSEYLEKYRDMNGGIDVRFDAALGSAGGLIPPPAELQLMRIVQEALSNVRKHAGATAVSVVLRRDGNELLVEVSDDGEGFDPANRAPTGWPRFGLQTMRERAEAVGGRFLIESSPRQGTRVAVRVPLSEGPAERRP